MLHEVVFIDLHSHLYSSQSLPSPFVTVNVCCGFSHLLWFMPLPSVETEILQAENDIKSLQAKLNDIASNHQEQEVHIFQTIQNGF